MPITTIGKKITAALADKKVNKAEVDGLIAEAMKNQKLSAAEKKELVAFFLGNKKAFDAEAKTTLETFLGLNKPPAPKPQPKPADPVDAFETRTSPVRAGAIETVFTPGDEAKLMEYASLDAVIGARKADPKTYPPESNPYRIEYAVYNLTDPEVVRRLTDAAKAGVHVQVLVDAKSIAPSKWWSSLVKDLTAAGFSYAPSQNKLADDVAARRDTQLIGMDMPGIFHLKTRYFSYPDPVSGELQETVLTGSYNPEIAAQKNDESLHRINDRTLVHQYLKAVELMRDGKPVQNTWDDACPVNALFTVPNAVGPKPLDKIFSLIDQEKEFIGMSVFTLRELTGSDKTKLLDHLKAAKDRGVKVVILTDKKQADGVDIDGKPQAGVENDGTDEKLEKLGIPVYEAINKAGPYNAMHLKASIFGLQDMKVVTDAGNWTYSVMGSGASTWSNNAESLLFIDSGKLDGNATGQRYLGEFMRVLRKYGDQNPDHTDVETLIADLQKMPNWPKVKVDFNVVAKTHMGQDVFIVGNTEELGRWGEAGPGLKLDTDASTYPNWKSAAVEVPLGTRFEYKVVKRDRDGGMAWEPGQNAVLIVDPTRGQDLDDLTISDDYNGDR
ncbi:MAG: phospholipase D-like domain-containing protein [Myxococcales bacterium]